MHPIEPCEPRQLLAATLAGDPSFGTNGSVALAPGFGVEVLATHGAVYVEHYDTRRGTVYLSRYTDAGQPDTTWGDGGSVRPQVTRTLYGKNATAPALDYGSRAAAPAKLVYDPRTGGVLLAVDGGRTLGIERFTADGHDDTAWGAGGVVRYTADANNDTLAVGRLQPTGGKKLVVALRQTETYATPDAKGLGTDNAGTALLLARFDRLGRPDKAFHRGRPLTLREGHRRVVTEESDDGYSFDRSTDTNAPVFGDLLVTATGYRVVATREQTVSHYSSSSADDSSSTNGRTKTLVDAFDVSAGGGVTAGPSTVVARADGGFRGSLDRFDVLAVQATGPADTAVLGDVDTAFGPHYRVLRITGGAVVSDTPSGGDLGTDSNSPYYVARNADGVTFVTTPAFRGRTVRFTPGLKVDEAFGDDGAAFGPTSATGDLETLLNTPDSAGRLISLDRTAAGAQTMRRLV